MSGVELSFSAKIGTQRILITFGGENNTFSTIHPEIQTRIEKRPDFGTVIKLISTSDVPDAKQQPTRTLKQDQTGETPPLEQQQEKQETQPATFDTKDWQEAKDILRGEPYNTPFQAINTPEKILAKAELLGIQFPNLQLCE